MTNNELKEYFTSILEEKDKVYLQMFNSIKDTAIATTVSSKEALARNDISLADYKVHANEFRTQLERQATTLLSRQEAATEFQQIRLLHEALFKQIVELQRFQSSGEGSSKSAVASRTLTISIIGLILSATTGIVGTIIGIVSAIIFSLV